MGEEALRTIYLAGGCFWGVEAFMSHVSGVIETRVGYANGTTENPTYQEVCTGRTGHTETVEVHYNANAVSLNSILKAFFEIIDPTSVNRQGNDVGSQYRTGVYYVRPEDREVVSKVFDEIRQAYSQPLVTELKPLENFSIAEEYHQKYLEKNPNGYCHVDMSKLKGLEESLIR